MNKKILLIILLILPICVYANDTIYLDKCIDGDTFKAKIEDKIVKVRLLAVDAPELSHDDKSADYYGVESSNYTCNKLTNANKIEIEYDIDKTDKYDRVLGWIYIDDVLLQEDLVVNGYAKVAYLYKDYKYNNLLKEKEVIAKENAMGLWNNGTPITEKESIYTKYILYILIFILLVMILLVNYKFTIAFKKSKITN